MPVFAPGTSILTPMPLTVHRFEQTIGGQHYVVEVRPALRGRWRASLVWKWQAEKGPPWPREKGPPSFCQFVSP